MENPVVDGLEAVARQQDGAWHARIQAELAAFRAHQDQFSSEARASIHEKRQYRKRQERQGAGPHLTGLQWSLLTNLAFLNDMGIEAISVPELSNRVGCSPRTIQYGLSRLEAAGYVKRTIRPGRNPRRHLPSLVKLLPAGWTRLNRIGPVGHLSTQKFADPSEDKNKTLSTKSERSAGKPSRTIARATPSAAALANLDQTAPETTNESFTAGDYRPSAKSENLDAPPGIDNAPALQNSPVNEDELDLARKAAAKLHPSRQPTIERSDPFEVLDAVRRQHLSNFPSEVIARAVRIHGREATLLSVGLALLRKVDGRGQEIRSAASYLGGMLRSPPGKLNPLPSLRLLLNV